MKLIIIAAIAALNLNALERKDISITVYNQNMAVVKDVRNVDLKKGLNQIDFDETATSIVSESVRIKFLKTPVNILEQNFEYDLVNSSKMLMKFIDNQIKVITKDNNVFSGSLLSFDEGYILLKSDDGKVNMVSRENLKSMEFSKMPANFRTKPTLTWLVNSSKAGDDQVEVSYMARSMSWQADYVITLAENDKNLDINSWVSVTNNSGASYDNASLKLMAGDVNLVDDDRGYAGAMRAMSNKAAAFEDAEPQFKEKSFFEYHIYNLSRKADLKNNQTKQISLFNASAVKAEKVYVYDGAMYRWYFYNNWKGQKYNKKVDVSVKFKNSKDNNLGMPFPKGKIRIYKKDGADVEFVGEDSIDHTPKDEQIDLKVGQAFDITGERKITNHQTIVTNVYRDSYEIKLKNHKDEAVKVTVRERLYGDWKIVSNSHDYAKKDANTIEFDVNIPKNGSVTLTYSAEAQF